MKHYLIIIIAALFFCARNTADGQKSLYLNDKNKYKIAQFTDLHYNPKKDSAKAPVALIREVLAIEKPDLVVLTGDVVTGSSPVLEHWEDIVNAIESTKTPWAVIFGNHDDEYDKTRGEIMEYLVKKKYCLAVRGPENIKGTGNYTLEICKGDSVKFVLYCMDSHAYTPIKGVGTYDWFAFNQIEWYRAKSKEYTAKNSGVPVPALAFFHIPLVEYSEMVTRRKYKGMRNENECPGIVNTGMFAAMLESGDVMGTFVGHDHDNDYIGTHHGIALAYGRCSGTSKTTYLHMVAGSRIIELTGGEHDFKTWIRLHGGQVINSTSRSELMK